MPRTDDDTWDITHSVGVTALGVAAARAAETESENPLISDPFARMFVERAGAGAWSVYSGSTLPEDADPDALALVHAMVDFMAVRTKFFDDFFLAAADAGIRQMVILASGLDARAWRLSWKDEPNGPGDTTVYELDQPQVLDFKATTLQGHGAHPAANVVYVPVDLRQDWPQALRDHGFDPAAPTAWSAEGLLRYLTAAAQDLLFERIHALSAPSSRVAANVVGAAATDPAHLARQRERMRRLRSVTARLVKTAKTEVTDLEELWYPEERTDLAAWLGEHGWKVTSATLEDQLARYGRGTSAGDLMPNVFVSAQRLRA